jgi:hypothetical protein
MMQLKRTTKTITTTGAILSATLVTAAAAFLLFSVSPQAQAQTEDDITTTIREGLASGFEAGAGEADEGGNSDLGDEFRAVVDSLRGGDDICTLCG